MPAVEDAGWHVSYLWSKSSGLRLGVCDYRGDRVLQSAAVPFVYVTYQGNRAGPFTDELRSTSADVELREILHGFDLKVRYDLYGPDYEYEQVWRFHDDGQFGSTVLVHGPGEEIRGQHSYHVPFRFDLDVSGKGGDCFQRRGAGEWVDVPREGQHLPVAPPNWDWRVLDRSTGKAALVRARAADAGELWALRYKRLESWSSWGGALEAVPGSAGSVPAIYDNGQSVQGANLVLWYIAHLGSVDGIAACGPWFGLEGYPQPEDDDKHPDHPQDDEHPGNDDDHDHPPGGGHHQAKPS